MILRDKPLISEVVLSQLVVNRSLSFPHCLIGCCGMEARYQPVDHTVVELWFVSGALLLGGSRSVQIC
jgi:hypothetical protein